MSDILQRICDAYARNPAEALKLLPELMDAKGKTVFETPCAIGTTVYNITWWDTVTESVKVHGKTYSRQIQKHKVSKSKFSWFDIENFRKTVFLTRPEAEKALEERIDPP